MNANPDTNATPEDGRQDDTEHVYDERNNPADLRKCRQYRSQTSMDGEGELTSSEGSDTKSLARNEVELRRKAGELGGVGLCEHVAMGFSTAGGRYAVSYVSKVSPIFIFEGVGAAGEVLGVFGDEARLDEDA
ncbi:hypothetical protein PLICRDRAFT_174269 [Plicaturopsis crispa FD-325 SS-3]|nr:hypothetical protein PLICRDRAFT_174269 [Plicaturopsis crispa FD-325 SS-3]